jgi:hypothetical protein
MNMNMSMSMMIMMIMMMTTNEEHLVWLFTDNFEFVSF